MKIIPQPEPKVQDPSVSQFYAQSLKDHKRRKEERGCNPMLIQMKPEELAKIKATSRIRGLYKAEMREFLASDSPGGQVDLTSGVFEGKQVATVMQGLTKAIEDLEAETQVKAVKNNDNVYLIRLDG